MKIKKLRHLRPVALVAMGVFLGRAAQANTTLDFDSAAAACTPPQVNNPNAAPGITDFGNFAAASSGGVTVSGGFGTPNIGLTWGGTPSPDTRWEYYNDGGSVWSAVQLQSSTVGSTEKITFAPNNPAASVVIKSFNLHGYYLSSERFTYNVSVVSGGTVVSGPTTFSFLSDGTKNHNVAINYTGAPGQTLKLRLSRVASTLGGAEVEGDPFDIAVDDIVFAQTPATTFPAGPQVVSVTPADDTTGIAANAAVPYAATIADGANTLVTGSVQLRLDGNLVSPSPTVTPLGGGQTSVSYPGVASLLTSGDHVYKLTYADNLGGIYTNETVFSSVYTTLPPSYALPSSAGVVGGFKLRSVSASIQVTNNLPNTLARAKAQLAGTLVNPATTLPFTNDAALGPNADGSFNVDGAFNFVDSGSSGNFVDDVPFPGLDIPPYDWFSTDASLYLNLPAGYYRFGVNSDDGFEVSATPPQGVSGSPLVLGLFDGGRGPADTLFDVQVQTSGIYPFRVIYFEGGGGAECEFFSVTNLATGDKVLVNDADPNAIKSFRVLKPQITSIAKSGANAVVNWAYGTPPFQVQVKTNLTDAAWSNVGAPTAGNTANVPIDSNTKFIRVGYSQP